MQGKEVVLRFVRDQLSRINAHALIVPTSDSHQSEYVAGYDKVRQYVSGFTGSAGTAIVTNPLLHPLSQLFTDGRYHEQAEKELDLSLWELQKSGLPTVLSPEQWLIKQFTHNAVAPVPTPHIVAYDPLQLSVAQYKTFSTALSTHNITLAPTATNFVSDAWNSLDSASREPISTSYVSVQTPEFSGPTTAAHKVDDLRKELIGKNAFALVLSALDDIAWTFNLRGSDIAFNPVFKSYAIITDSETILLVDDSDDKSRLVDAKKYLEDDFKAANSTLRILPYSDMQSVMTNIGNKARIRRDTGSHPNFLISIDPTKTNMMTYNAIGGIDGIQGAEEIVLATPSPVAARKAVKNAIEIAGMENSHIRDGLAVSSFLAYLESRLCDFPSRDATAEEKANSPYNEHTLASKLESYRAKQPLFKGLSFDTISSIGPNGSIIHYKPSETDSAPLTTGKVFLLDSGAQYNDGTTDITRTFFLSKPKDGEVVIGDEETDYAPSREQVTNNTLVLQGHIALCKAVFPKGTVGPALDILARQFLWKAGLDYAHGTGHGVGSYLNVHEGPLGVSPLSRGGLPLVTPLVPGMVLSNEPGFYKPGGYGIRIENLVQVVPAIVPNPTATLFYTLKNLTMVPLDRTLIDISMLSTAEKEWVNEYHDECKSNLIALLDSQQDDTKIHESKDDVERTRRWILRNTEAL